MKRIIVLDFGGQYNQLIARRVRDLHVYSEVLPFTTSLETLKDKEILGIIFTGGPNSVYDASSPHVDQGIFSLGKPILGICYGAQLIAYQNGGKVESISQREYGRKKILVQSSPLFKGLESEQEVFMSHGDQIVFSPLFFPSHFFFQYLPHRFL